MKVVHVKDETQRDACLARLCAEVYGHEAGIAPLATFAGTLSVLVTQEAARVLALIDNESCPIALALLVLDELGESMEVVLLAGLESENVAQPAEHLIAELALKAPLRVNAHDDAQEKMFRACGIKRWFYGPNGQRVGVSPRHAATELDDIPRTMHFDQRAVIQAFKQDKSIFEGYKQRFVRGLGSFPEVL